jgi:hypothetical protein
MEKQSAGALCTHIQPISPPTVRHIDHDDAAPKKTLLGCSVECDERRWAVDARCFSDRRNLDDDDAGCNLSEQARPAAL